MTQISRSTTGSVARKSEVIAIGPETTNGGKAAIEYAIPYVASVQIVGVADLLFPPLERGRRQN